MRALLSDVEAALVKARSEAAETTPGTPSHANAVRRVEDLEALAADVRSAITIGVEGEVSPFRAALQSILGAGGTLSPG